MNTKDNRRVILVKGDESKWYEQAIFILRPGRDGAAGAPLDFVKEAERIVSGKAAPAAILTPQLIAPPPPKNPPKPQNKRLVDFILNFMLILSCLVLFGIIMWNIL